jgi:hypothetical protein
MKMDLNLSAIGQRVFIPVFGRRDQGSRLPARPHHSQTRPWDPARRNQKLGPRKSHRHALSRGSTAYCSHQIPVLGPQDIQLRVAAASGGMTGVGGVMLCEGAFGLDGARMLDLNSVTATDCPPFLMSSRSPAW